MARCLARTVDREFSNRPAHRPSGSYPVRPVPRNAFRSSAEAFATDHLALAIAKMAIAGAFDASLSKDERLFLYLPFEHSENRDDQRESVRLISQLGDPDLLKYAQDHQAMIERFGRFPHRNKTLGRTDRPGEAEAVAAGNNW